MTAERCRVRPATILRDRYGEVHFWIEGLAVILGVLVLSGIVVVGIVMPITWHTNHVACQRLHEQTGYPTRMAGNMLSGECYIKTTDRYIPVERYINTDVNRPPQ